MGSKIAYAVLHGWDKTTGHSICGRIKRAQRSKWAKEVMSARSIIYCSACLGKQVEQYNYVLREHKSFALQGSDLVCLIEPRVYWKIRQGIIV